MRKAFTVWIVALAAYFLAVFNRSSLAVAGLIAADRFHISASQLATFTMLQLLVYAGMQIPVGLLVDRWGPRSVILCGIVVGGLAQAGFAFADSYPLALIARIFVGIGDSLTFICLLRLTASWFPVRRIALMSTLNGSIGQLGAILAAVPMTWALAHVGWTKAYLISSLAAAVLFAVALLILHDAPVARTQRGASRPVRAVVRDLGASWRHPGTRLAFWVHFTTPFSSNAMAMLWGLPFFVKGEGQSDHVAGLLISLITLASILSGPFIGWLIGHEPWHRSTLALGIIGANVIMWTLVFAWPGQAPVAVLALLALIAGIGGPASMIGFDLGRTSNPPEKYASASGIINQGGFVASLVLILAVGWILDWRTPGGGNDYTEDAFRWAFSFQYLIWALGVSQIWRFRKLARQLMPRAATAPVPAAE
ncbi:MFS transporter [Nocardioides sp. Kera G14]|uniref:MFS transporter n=1 Tax=Nocardioides sp. Kera G14 TaxID=2884264 RepID=UPI001D1193CA|nr:MFS transporter [Nocardioides sp. Kera G14]UDY22315.1 MFS transporter [Nocardioides sp. Kera G14]